MAAGATTTAGFTDEGAAQRAAALARAAEGITRFEMIEKDLYGERKVSVTAHFPGDAEAAAYFAALSAVANAKPGAREAALKAIEEVFRTGKIVADSDPATRPVMTGAVPQKPVWGSSDGPPAYGTPEWSAAAKAAHVALQNCKRAYAEQVDAVERVTRGALLKLTSVVDTFLAEARGASAPASEEPIQTQWEQVEEEIRGPLVASVGELRRHRADLVRLTSEMLALAATALEIPF